MKPNFPAYSLLLALCAAPFAVATPVTAPVSGAVQVSATATINGGPSQVDSHTDPADWLSIPETIHVNSLVDVSDGNGHRAFATGHTQAKWATEFYPDGSRGSWNSSYAWFVQGSFSGSVGFTGPEWTYTFVALQDAYFSMGFSMGLYDNLGNRLFRPQSNLVLNYSIVSDIPGLDGAINPFTELSWERAGYVTAGQTYTVSVYNNTAVSGALDSFFSSGTSSFEWELTALVPHTGVPETGSSLGLLGLGFAIFAVFARRFRGVL